MTDTPIEPAFEPEAFAIAAAVALSVRLDPAWLSPVAANLRVLMQAAERVGAFPLPDEAEAAPVFEA